MSKVFSFGKTVVFLSIMASLVLWHCDPEDPIGVSCQDCYTRKPDSSFLYIEFTINSENQQVPFWLYQGDPEDNQVIYADTFRVSSVQFWLPVNKHYSAKAEYKKGNKTIFAFDGDDLETRKVSGECSTDCFVVTGDNINLTLK